MLSSFGVRNFRCFAELEIANLKRVNIVVGRNAAGKTAFLEAVRLALGGTPVVLFSLNQNRQLNTYIPTPATRDQFETYWKSYFYNFDSSNPISTSCFDSGGAKAELKIYYDPERAITTAPQQQLGAMI